ncbi:MAG: hypothetical protein U0790_18945 [Isosphaeraceae bacterium]
MDQEMIEILRNEVEAKRRAQAQEARAQVQDAENQALKQRVLAQDAAGKAAERRSRRRLAVVVAAGLVVAWSSTPEVEPSSGSRSRGDQRHRLTAVEAKTARSLWPAPRCLSAASTCRSSMLGMSQSTSGLGNLTVGYNATRDDDSDARTGSHNLILGDYNNYTSYGGLVAGYFNTISGFYCSVSGGAGNTASGNWSSVSGGVDNTASGNWSSVSGGDLNTASHIYSSVSGGGGNKATGIASSVSGGFNRSANPNGSWAAGGLSQAN